MTLVINITCTSAAAALFCVLLAARDFAVKAFFVFQGVEHKMMRMVVDDCHFVKSLMSFASVMGGCCW